MSVFKLVEPGCKDGSIATRHTHLPAVKSAIKRRIPRWAAPHLPLVARSHLHKWFLGAGACPPRLLIEVHAGPARNDIAAQRSLVDTFGRDRNLARTGLDSRLFGHIMSTSSDRELANGPVAMVGLAPSFAQGAPEN